MLNRRLIRTKVLRSLFAHINGEKSRTEATINEYKKSLELCYDLHLFLLDLLVETVGYAEERHKIAAAKLRPTFEDLNPKMRFVDNSIILSLKNNEDMQKRLRAAGLSWGEHEEVVREMYSQITNSDFYTSYLDGAGKDREFVLKVLNKLYEDNETIEQAIEDMSILWADDMGYALGESISAIEKCEDNKILPMFKDPDDKIYGERLLLHSISHCSEYLELIELFSKNWELERIAFMDKMILVVAISELVSCPTIPTKVTLNEYIEISKFYSTPTSYNFINGVLHKTIEKLTEEGRIEKRGRGLINSKVNDTK